MKVSFLKKVSFYFSYRKILLSNKKEFENSYNLRIDRVNRLYTVMNIPESAFGEPYNLRTSDISKISEPILAQFTKQISELLEKKGLSELYRLYDIKKVDKFSFLIIIGFSLFDTDKLAKLIFFRVLPTLITASLLILLFYLYY